LKFSGPEYETLSISPIVAEFSAASTLGATLTSVVAPLICPSSLRPEPFSGRFLMLP
jgi:hypothetical protein